MGNKIRIHKRYTSGPKTSIEEEDVVEIEGGSEECARFITAVNANPKADYEIIDYEPVLITKTEGPQIIKNPTGGRTGKVLLPGKDF